MSEMIERVGREIASETICDKYNGPHNSMPCGMFCQCFKAARPVIAAMREPTDAMMAVNEMKTDHHHKWILRADKQVWQAMIDAALTEP
jgi:hypothetical protein